jgi:hypothetical protein
MTAAGWDQVRWDALQRKARAETEPTREPGLGALAILKGIPGFAGRLKPVPANHWTETPMGCLVACPCGTKPALQTGRFSYCTGCDRYFLFDGQGLWVTHGLAPDRRCGRCGDEVPSGDGHCGDCAAEFLMDVEHEAVHEW